MFRFFTAFGLLAGSAMAATMITADPSTSPAWPVGTFFEPGEVSQTTDPLGPLSGTAITFRGWQQGGSQVSLDGGPCSLTNSCLVFFYHVTFSDPVNLNSISFSGDAFNRATFQLLNSTGTVIDSLNVSTGNVGHSVTEVLNTPGATGTSFSVRLFDNSTTWTYVNNITGDVTSAVPEPASYVAVFTGMCLIACLAWRKRQLQG